MAGRSGGRGRVPYVVRFVVATAILLGVTGYLVVFLLPERFVLDAGLRESGFNFPAPRVGFAAPEPAAVVQPPPPPAPPPEPGPAERLWSGLDSLLSSGRWDEAVRRMDAWVAERPGDLSVRRERARTLARAGRTAEAEQAWRELAADTRAVPDRLALARALRDREAWDRALAVYDALAIDRPDDLDLLHERALAYAWAGQPERAAELLRELLARSPGRNDWRLELARALYASDRLEESRTVLAGIPAGSPESDEARALDTQLAALLAPPAPPETPPPSLAERARAATEAGDLDEAEALWRRALDEAADDESLWREWIDFIQFRLDDQEAARDALLLFSERFALTPDDRFRLAQLHAWTGQETEAEAILEALVAEHPDRADAWALLGDLRRWRGERPAAAKAYARALEAEPGDSAATAGEEELARARRAAVARVEPAGVGPVVSLFGDTEEFLRLDAGVTTGIRGERSALRFEGGFRRLEGVLPSGLQAGYDGGFGSVEGAYWWREATIRTALRVGLESFATLGTEPFAALALSVPDLNGTSVTAELTHGPAYPITATLESAAEEVRADRLSVALYRAFDERWSAGASVDVGILDGAGTSNPRWGGRLSLARSLGSVFGAEVETGAVGYGEASPVVGRRLYWDPRLFWWNTLSLSAARRPAEGWGWRLRLTGGAAYADERDLPSAEWVPQLGADGGLSLRGRGIDFDADLFYRQSRESGYRSWGLAFRLYGRP